MSDQVNPNRMLLDEADWGSIKATLLAFTIHRCGKKHESLAPDLVQTAIVRVYAYDSKWDPAKEPDLLRYLMSVVNSLLWNERTRASTVRTSSLTSKATSYEASYVPDPQAFSEDKAGEHDLLSRRLTLLSERLAGDPQALRVLQLLVEGIDSPIKIRSVTGWSAAAVMAARERMFRAAGHVARAIGAPSEDDDVLTRAAEDGRETDEDEEEEVA